VVGAGFPAGVASAGVPPAGVAASEVAAAGVAAGGGDLTSFLFTTLFIRVLLGACASVFSVVPLVVAGFPVGVAATGVASAGVLLLRLLLEEGN